MEWVVYTMPQPLYPRETQCPLYKGLGGAQAQSGGMQKTSPPWEFGACTVQPVASHYSDYAVAAHRAHPATS